MAYVNSIFELAIFGVADANVPNLERVLIRPAQSVDLGEFGVFNGVGLPTGLVAPIRDSFFWFGDLVIAPPSWIVLYTGAGQYRVETTASGEKVHVFYWNRLHTLYTTPTIVPVVFKIGSIAIGKQLPGPPQIAPVR